MSKRTSWIWLQDEHTGYMTSIQDTGEAYRLQDKQDSQQDEQDRLQDKQDSPKDEQDSQ